MIDRPLDVFLYRLAGHLHRSVDELLDTVSMREIREWNEFDSFQPIGDRRGDYHAAMLMAQQANMHRSKTSPVRSISDFMVFDKVVEKRREVAAVEQGKSERATISMDTVVYLFAAARKTANLQDAVEAKAT